MCYFFIRGVKVRSYSSRELIKLLKADGWYEVNCVGDHHHFKHPNKKGRVTITYPKKDMPLKTVITIARQAGITLPR